MTSLIHMNQYNSDKQSLEKKNGDVDKNLPGVIGLVTTAVLNTKIGETENKIPDLSGIVKKIDCSIKISDIETKFFWWK